MQLRRYWPVVVTALAVIVLQVVLSAADATYYMTQVTMSAYYALVVIGLCLLMGYAGQASLGHAGFFAIGGYTVAFMTTVNLLAYGDAWWIRSLNRLGLLVRWQNLYGAEVLSFSAWPAFLTALALTALIAFLIGMPVIRLKGHYLAMATLGFGLIVYRIALGTRCLGQADGLSNVPPFRLIPGLQVNGRAPFRIENYYIAWAAVLIAMILAVNLVHSRVGRALRSIHQSEEAAHSLGVNTYRYKLAVFVLSALFAAVGGALMTHYNGSIGPSEATVMKSVRYVAIVAVGGMANLWGAMLMAILLNFLSLRGVFGTFDDAVFGAILIGIMIFAPQGLLRCQKRGHSTFSFEDCPAEQEILEKVECPLFREGGRMDSVLLETKGLHRSFGGVHAIRDVSIQVPQGAIKAIIGPNGAGKTTLFNLIAGTIPPQQGEVTFQGRRITAWKPHAVAGLGIARTFQTTKLFPHMTVLENVMVGRHPRTRSGFLAGMLNLPRTWREDRQTLAKAEAILDDLGLRESAGETASNLSFGRQRLVEFARALATEPILLLLDEPAAGLNIYETKALSELILKIRRRGVTCLIVEHDMSLVMNISDDVVVLDQGQEIAEGPPRVIQRDPEVIRIYLGDDYVENSQS